MTNTERQAVLNFKITGQETVGEIKGHLKDLKKVLDETTVGSNEYKESIKGIAESQRVLTGVMNETKGSVEYAKGSYYELNQELVNTRRAYKELSEEERNSSVGTEMLSRIQSLDGQLKDLDATIGQHQRNVGHYELALQALTKTYSSQKAELAAMKSAMDNLDPSTKEYAQAFDRAAQITHNLSQRQEILKYSSKDLGDQLSNIRGIASNMAAGFSAAQAAIGLFGGESEEVRKAMLKVQQAMALVQGLQGLDGLIKRTQGLSNALGVSRTATMAQTTALQGEAVATETATVAQKGLNTAMKANPIGIVIIAVQALITVWALFKDKIIEAIGGQERLNAIMDTVAPILSGVGNAIIKFLITPIKQFLVTIKGVAAVVDDIIHGKFKKAWQDAGDYSKKWVETTVNGYNVVGNYTQGYADKRKKIEEKHVAEQKELYDKDKDNYIKDQEAKHGSDWKYTAEGKKAYDEFYKNKMSMYKKDSEEYRQAQRDMWAYQRDYDNRKKKSISGVSSAASAAAKQAEQEAKEIKNAYETQVVDYVLNDILKASYTAVDRIKALGDEFIREGYKGGLEFKAKWDAIVGDSTKNIVQKFTAVKNLILEFFGDNAIVKKLVSKTSEDVAKTFSDVALNAISKLETEAKAAAEEIAFAFSNKEFKDGIKYPEEALEQTVQETDVYIDAYKKMTEEVEKQMTRMKEAGLENTEEYKRLETKKTEIANQEAQKRLEIAQREADIMKKYYDQQIRDLEDFYKGQEKASENAYSSKNFGGPAENKFYNESIRNILTGMMPADEMALMEELHKIHMEALEKRKETLEQMTQDTKLSNEQRVEAERELAATMAEIEDAELQHTIDMNTKRAESWQYWVDMVSEGIGAVGDLFGNLADYYEADIQARLKAGEITEAQAEDEYKHVQNMRLHEVAINTIAGAIGAFLQASATYPPPYGEIIGGISAAAITAAGLAEWKKIKSSTLNGSSSSAGAGGTVYATATPIVTDYNPQGVTNVTGGQETEDLRNALMGTQIVVSVVDINEAQKKVEVRDSEATW